MRYSTIKKILGKKGTNLARKAIDYTRPKILTMNLNNNPFKVYTSKSFKFWKIYQSGNCEPKTLRIFDAFLDKNHSYIDIGAWIGSTVLYASHLSKHCYAFEPDPIAYSQLTRNVSLNDYLSSKISLYDICISDNIGTAKLYFPDTHTIGRSLSSIVERGKDHVIVNTITIDEFIQENHVDDCNFIKMDIEGGEFIVLPSMMGYLQEQKPTLLIELHAHSFQNPKEKLENLLKIFELYKNRYDNDLKQISIEQIFDFAKKGIFHLVLSEKTL